MGSVLLPVGQWVFLCSTTSTIAQKQNGFRYTLPSTSTQTVAFGTRSPSGSFYDLARNATVYIGGDGYKPMSSNWLQAVRLYLNYFPNSVDEMINLAVMETSNIFTFQT